MTNLPPSRTADRIIIRLPDGMRERLHARAEANGRSMTAEVVAMLENGLNGGAALELESLVNEFGRLNQQRKMMAVPLADIDERISVVLQGIRAIAAADSVGDVPEELKKKSYDLYSVMTRGIGNSVPPVPADQDNPAAPGTRKIGPRKG